jgi:hypothetical protein
MSIANYIYVFNNPAYTTKTTPLEFKKKKKKIDVYMKDLRVEIHTFANHVYVLNNHAYTTTTAH